jgi:hypothetical protein
VSETQSQGRRAPKKGRSPSYPAIDLEAAIKRAETLYQHEKMHAAPITAIVKHWGYTTHKSGIASTQYAALKKFGLLTEEGSGDDRQGKLTDLAYAILHNPHEDERLTAIQSAALTPPIHREMWDHYGTDLPSEATLRYRLVTERGFTDAGAEDFVKQFKATISFAMKDGGPVGEEPGDTPSDPDEADDHSTATGEILHADPARRFREQQTRQPTAASSPSDQHLRSQQMHAPLSQGTRIPIPLVGGQQIVIEGEFPITEAAWANFQAVLQAFKPGIVVPNPVSVPPAPGPTPEFRGLEAFGEDENDETVEPS